MEKAVEIDPKNIEFLCDVRAVNFYLKNYEKVLEICEKVKKIDKGGNDVEDDIYIADCFIGLSKYEEAEKIYAKLYSKNKKCPEVLEGYASMYEDMGLTKNCMEK